MTERVIIFPTGQQLGGRVYFEYKRRSSAEVLAGLRKKLADAKRLAAKPKV